MFTVAGPQVGAGTGRGVANVNIVPRLSMLNNELSVVCCDLNHTIKVRFTCLPFCTFQTFHKLLAKLLLEWPWIFLFLPSFLLHFWAHVLMAPSFINDVVGWLIGDSKPAKLCTQLIAQKAVFIVQIFHAYLGQDFIVSVK